MSAKNSSWSSGWLALRSLLWTVLLPGVIAAYVPWRYFGLSQVQLDLTRLSDVVGVMCIALGVVLLAACIFEFAWSGRGTLSPADPPRHLVVRGLYRYVRNPMYLSVTMILLGEALVVHSVALTIYWVVWFAGANIFVLCHEEPALRRRFGSSYDEYTQRVARWIPRFEKRVK